MAKATKTGNIAVPEPKSPSSQFIAQSQANINALKEQTQKKLGTPTATDAANARNALSNFANSIKTTAQNIYNTYSSPSYTPPSTSAGSAPSYGGGGSGGRSGGSYSNRSGGGSGGGSYETPGIIYSPSDFVIGSDPSTENPGLNPNAGSAAGRIVAGARASLPTADVRPIDLIDTSYQRMLLDSIKASQDAQAQKQIDYAVSTGVRDLSRNLEDSREQFQTMRNQVDADEAKALDNQVLYAEARGDRGGLGMAQYGGIQNTAAVNRLAVNNAQTKLATDTARQIADLRAQGEFEKADKLLEISQAYLGQLMDLYQYAQSTNVGIQEFNAGLQQWMAEYNLNRAKYLTDTELEAASLAGAFSDGTPTQAAWQFNRGLVADAANALLAAGVAPTTQQLAAIGMTGSQAQQYIANTLNGGAGYAGNASGGYDSGEPYAYNEVIWNGYYA